MRVHADCRHFDGFKPCRFRRPCEGCPEFDRPAHRVLIVNLDALGDVVRTTALLAPLHRALPGAHVTWLTLPRARPLLEQVEGVDRILSLADWTPALLQVLQFDRVLGVDKSLHGGALTMAARATERRGFGLDAHGSVIPLNPEAGELYGLGLDDDLKFRVNSKPETRLLCEAMGWKWERDPYRLGLSDAEGAIAQRWRAEHGLAPGDALIGFNTGSSELFSYKRMTVEDSAGLVDRVAQRCPDAGLALLGGPEDGERNRRIADLCTARTPAQTPCDKGLRHGLAMVAACDVVTSGDSLGMHMAIGLGKPTVAWFGPSCHPEIDLYGRGAWVLADVDCRPCMRPRCDRPVKCFTRVPLSSMADQVAIQVEAVRRGEDPGPAVLVGDWPDPRRIE